MAGNRGFDVVLNCAIAQRILLVILVAAVIQDLGTLRARVPEKLVAIFIGSGR